MGEDGRAGEGGRRREAGERGGVGSHYILHRCPHQVWVCDMHILGEVWLLHWLCNVAGHLSAGGRRQTLRVGLAIRIRGAGGVVTRCAMELHTRRHATAQVSFTDKAASWPFGAALFQGWGVAVLAAYTLKSTPLRKHSDFRQPKVRH